MIGLLPRRGLVWMGGAFLICSSIASGQQKTQTAGQRSPVYDVSREVSVQGSVISFTETPTAAPFGPHVRLQSSSDVLDIQLGNARLLESNHFTLAAGDEIRVVGENVSIGASGSQFVARMIQKGNQTLLLRSAQGFPLRPAARPGDSKGAL
jgi:hypothetical protein